MNNTPLEVSNIWKKFKKGERFDSLRDLIPAMSKRIFSRNQRGELGEKEFWALKNVSFQVKKGEALGIIGPNGAGKSTILKLLSGIMKPNKGKINVNGRLSALIEVGAGFHSDLTGRENIFLNATILGMKRDEIKRKFDEIVEFSGLSEFIDTPVKRYSSGMYARLGFSVAAHVDPEILLIDEVLSVGDFMFQDKCLKKMMEIVKGGTTVIFISHNIPSVIRICPTTILLNRGEIQRYGESKDVCRYYYRAHAENRKLTEDETFVIKEFNLYDKNNIVSNAFMAGDWAKGKLIVESQAAYEDLIMGFFVKQSDGMVVFDANSDKFSNKYFAFRAGETKEIEFGFRANLPEGTYYIGIHFMKGEEGFCLYSDEIMELHVNAPKTFGNAFLDIEW